MASTMQVAATAHGGTVVVTITSGSGYNNSCGDSNTCLQPFMLKVPVGTRVMWINNDSSIHTVTSGSVYYHRPLLGMFFDSGKLLPGQTFTYQFNHTGAYTYVDTLHGWVTGLVMVK